MSPNSIVMLVTLIRTCLDYVYRLAYCSYCKSSCCRAQCECVVVRELTSSSSGTTRSA